MKSKIICIVFCLFLIINSGINVHIASSEPGETEAILWYGWQSRLVCINLNSDGVNADFTESPLIQDTGDPMPYTAFLSLTMLEDGSLLWATQEGSTRPFISKIFHIEEPQCDGSTSTARYLGIMPEGIGIEALYTDSQNQVYIMDTGSQHSSSSGNRLLKFTGDVTTGDFSYEVVGSSTSVPDIDGMGPGIDETTGWVVDTPGFAIDSYNLYNVDYETGVFSYIGSNVGPYATHAINGSFYTDGKSRLFVITGFPQSGGTVTTLYEIDPDTGATIQNLGSGPSGVGLTGSLVFVPSDDPEENDPPVADAGGNQINNEGDTVHFDGSSSYDPDGTIEIYQWDFDLSVDSDGDGDPENDIDAFGPNPSHIYGDNGLYNVALKVTDNQGMVNIDTCEITVQNVAPLISMFGPFTVNEGSPLTISAIATDPGSDDLTFTWVLESGPTKTTTYYNDGVGADPYPSPLGNYPFSASDTIEHTYGDNSMYFVALVVSDDDGGESVYNTAVTVNNLAPSGGISNIFLGDEGSSISFSATGSDFGSDDLTFNWNWGDGTPDTVVTFFNDGTGPDPAKSPDGIYPFNVIDLQDHVYGDNANYTVTLTITDDDLDEVIYTTLVSVDNVAPTINPFNITAVDENSPTVISASATDPGSDDLTFTWELELGPTISNVYYNDGIGSDPYPSPQGDYPFTANDTIGYTYGDNGEYLITLKVEDDDGGLTTYTTTAIVKNVQPTINLYGETIAYENNPITLGCFATDLGSDDLTVTWDWGDGFSPSVFTTYFNDGTGPDPYPSPYINPMAINDSQMQTYGDNGVFTVTVTVLDDDGGIAISIINVTVENIDPVIESLEAYVYVKVSLRVAGEKWHSVGVQLFEEDSEIWAATVTRYPGDPDRQAATIEGIRMDMTKSYTALVDYLPNDPRVNGNVWGGTPVWIILEFEDGSEKRIHHTFNVRQSDWDSDHWNHVEPWEVDLNAQLIGWSYEVDYHVTDPGSDDETLTFTYGSQNVMSIYRNNPPIPDPYPSPEVNPRDIYGTQTLVYEGAGTLTLQVEDDDGGEMELTLELA